MEEQVPVGAVLQVHAGHTHALAFAQEDHLRRAGLIRRPVVFLVHPVAAVAVNDAVALDGDVFLLHGGDQVCAGDPFAGEHAVLRAVVIGIVILPVVAGVQHSARRQVQAAVAFQIQRADQVIAGRYIDHAAVVNCPLDCSGVQRNAVPNGTVIPNISHKDSPFQFC